MRVAAVPGLAILRCLITARLAAQVRLKRADQHKSLLVIPPACQVQMLALALKNLQIEHIQLLASWYIVVLDIAQLYLHKQVVNVPLGLHLQHNRQTVPQPGHKTHYIDVDWDQLVQVVRILLKVIQFEVAQLNFCGPDLRFHSSIFSRLRQSHWPS